MRDLDGEIARGTDYGSRAQFFFFQVFDPWNEVRGRDRFMVVGNLCSN